MIINQAMISHFNNRTKKHIELVNYYASKLGKSFPNHDIEKFDDSMKNAYIIVTWCTFRNMDIPSEDLEMIQETMKAHYNNSKHHPEYWENIEDMDEDSLIEMCADWCAMSKEMKNDPFNWAEHTIGYRWDFSEKQIYFIHNTLNKMWSDEP